MIEFLQASEIIDFMEPGVSRAVAELAKGTGEEELIARRCFEWVRDHVKHSIDHRIPIVTCKASEVLKHMAGFCYAKSHLLVALLRANGIPAGFCYQRLAVDDAGAAFCLHGLVAVHLKSCGWYRCDPRGDKPGIVTDFCPPLERLAFHAKLPGERDIPGRFAEPLPQVVATLQKWETAEEVCQNLPDLGETGDNHEGE